MSSHSHAHGARCSHSHSRPASSRLHASVASASESYSGDDASFARDMAQIKAVTAQLHSAHNAARAQGPIPPPPAATCGYYGVTPSSSSSSVSAVASSSSARRSVPAAGRPSSARPTVTSHRANSNSSSSVFLSSGASTNKRNAAADSGVRCPLTATTASALLAHMATDFARPDLGLGLSPNALHTANTPGSTAGGAGGASRQRNPDRHGVYDDDYDDDAHSYTVHNENTSNAHSHSNGHQHHHHAFGSADALLRAHGYSTAPAHSHTTAHPRVGGLSSSALSSSAFAHSVNASSASAAAAAAAATAAARLPESVALMREYPYGRTASAVAAGPPAVTHASAAANSAAPKRAPAAKTGAFRSKLGVLPYRIVSVTSESPRAPASSLLARDSRSHWAAHSGANHEIVFELASPALVGFVQLSNRATAAAELSVSFRGRADDDWVTVARDDRLPRGKVTALNAGYLPTRFIKLRLLRGAPASLDWVEVLGVPAHLAETVLGAGAREMLVTRPLEALLLPPQPVLRADRRHRQAPYPLSPVPKERPAGAAQVWEGEPGRHDGTVCLH